MRRSTLSLLLIAAMGLAAPRVLTANPRHSPSQRPPHTTDAGAVADAGTTSVTLPRPPRERESSERRGRPRPLQRTLPSPAQAQPCGVLSRGDRDGRWVHSHDVLPSLGFVDGDDLLTIVNRSPRFVLSPEYAPTDLVDIESGAPRSPSDCVPHRSHCLRREAAEALRLMLEQMALAGYPGHVHSAFRSFDRQCEVFRDWSHATGQNFCRATTSSAIAGHSQHQLGTAIDLFTTQWANAGEMMRPGFGCTPAGRWIADHAWEFGFVLPYPLPLEERVAGASCHRRREDVVDPRTGYRYEPWHLRYIGVEAAARFRRAWEASGPDEATEITLEQWLRQERSIDADADLPVCDGCSCGLCTTFHDGTAPASGEPPPPSRRGHSPAARPTGPCGERALLIGPDGSPVRASTSPRITSAEAHRDTSGVRVRVTLEVPPHTVTQTPVTSREGAVYGPDDSWRALGPSRRRSALHRAYPDLHGAWRVALAPRRNDTWPWRAALVPATTPAWVNGATLRLPAPAGTIIVEVTVPRIGDLVRATLMRDGRTEGPTHDIEIR
jgi:zinc D-Ala-D-Ala carboxypeptidase